MDEDAIGRKLDAIVSILKLAHKEELDKARTAIRGEPVKAAILEVSSEWTAAGSLVKSAAEKAKKSERTVQVNISELLDLGVLEKRGATRTLEYRSTGVI